MGNSDLEISPKKHTVKIEYCVPCDYSDHTLRAAQELVKNYQHVLDEIVLEMGSKGTFEIEVDGDTLFSKQELERHPEPGEVLDRFRQYVGDEVQTYPGG